MPNLTINGQSFFADAPPDTPLLWVIREELRLTGTKFGCGMGLCGSCTVHVNGQAVRSCLVKVERRGGRAHHHHRRPGPGQRASRCSRPGSSSRCRNAATASRARSCRRPRCSRSNPNPTDQEIVDGMNGNLCRCATYPRIVGAVKRAAQIAKEGSSHD